MNERIDELIFQVGYTKLSYPDDNFLDGRYALTQEQLDKFAELIVRECIELNKQELAFNAFERMLNRYREHFGVE